MLGHRKMEKRERPEKSCTNGSEKPNTKKRGRPKKSVDTELARINKKWLLEYLP
jgi:hypothetical protein